MTAVSIIDIEVKDEAFKRLKDQFDLFQTAVKQQPAAWSAVSGQAHNVQVAIAGTATTMAGLSTGQDKVAKQAVGIAKTFQGIANDSTKLAKNVAGITRDLVRWVGFGAIFTGLLGGGGLFGLNRMAAGVLYPAFGLLLSPVVAALAMSLSSVSVIGNALRLRAARLEF